MQKIENSPVTLEPLEGKFAGVLEISHPAEWLTAVQGIASCSNMSERNTAVTLKWTGQNLQASSSPESRGRTYSICWPAFCVELIIQIAKKAFAHFTK